MSIGDMRLSLNISGARGVGKTHVLGLIIQKLREDGYSVVIEMPIDNNSILGVPTESAVIIIHKEN